MANLIIAGDRHLSVNNQMVNPGLFITTDQITFTHPGTLGLVSSNAFEGLVLTSRLPAWILPAGNGLTFSH